MAPNYCTDRLKVFFPMLIELLCIKTKISGEVNDISIPFLCCSGHGGLSQLIFQLPQNIQNNTRSCWNIFINFPVKDVDMSQSGMLSSKLLVVFQTYLELTRGESV